MFLRFILLLIATATFSVNSMAQQAFGKVTGYLVTDSSGSEVLFVRLNSATSEACNTTGRFALRSTGGTHFKSTVAAIVAAYHAQSDVTITFSKQCTQFGNSFDLQYACVGVIPC